MPEKTLWEKLLDWTRNSLTLKLMLIFFLVLILLIPAAAVEELVRERSSRSLDVIQEINNKWGEPQVLEGAVIVVPFKTQAQSQIINEAFIYPTQIAITGDITTQTKKRGIYKSNVYAGNFELQADFSTLKNNAALAGLIPLWEKTFILVGLDNLRGLNNDVLVSLNDKNYAATPGLKTEATSTGKQTTTVFTNGFHINAPLNTKLIQSIENYNLKISMQLNGVENINIVPLTLGKTRVSLSSNWNNPSFEGEALPSESNITPDGFTAQWDLSNYGDRSPKDTFNYNLTNKQFGVSFLQPVSHYQKVTRATKYSSLFLVLTFLLIMLLERIIKVKIHALQYLLVGLAMLLFYVLLLSISEYLQFELTYLLASLATIALIGFYSISLFKKKQFSLILVVSLAVLYGFLFFLLQAQDYSLLVGSLSLFVLLAMFMYLTRNINRSTTNI